MHHVEAMSDITFFERLSVNVTPDMRNAVRKAAERQGVTHADFVRQAICDRLALDGVPHQRPPLLSSIGFISRRRRT